MVHLFVETEQIEHSGGDGERRVWDALKRSCAGRECVAYWRYPMFSNVGEQRKEVDILLLDRELGMLAVEVKSIRAQQITAIDGHVWATKGFYKQRISPYQQAEDAAFMFKSLLERDGLTRNKVTTRAMVALPLISSAEWAAAPFALQPSAPQEELICSDHLTPAGLLRRLQGAPPLTPAPAMSDEVWARLLSLIGGAHLHRKEAATPRPTAPLQLKSEVITQARSQVYDFDVHQAQIGLSISNGAQRIRGIAGSGKTVILCQKIAHMALKHPDWRLGFVFFTRSLYDGIIRSIDQWLKFFSQGTVSYQQVADRIFVMHAWGSQDQLGLYSYACQLTGTPKRTPRDCNRKQPNEGLAESVSALLEHLHEEKITIPQVFDALLIDEGQDLVVDPPDLRFEDKQSIYWMAYQLLKPSSAEDPLQRRLGV